MSLRDYLEELFDPQRPVSSSKLLNLSGLNEGETTLYRGHWERAVQDRRANLIELLLAIAEDNAEADFGGIFRVALDDASPEIRIKAVEGLWECRERWLLNRLIQMIEEDPIDTVRAAAAGALGKFVLLGVFEELRPALVERVESTLKRTIADSRESAHVRARAIESLSPSADAGVNDIIRMAYHSEEQRLRLSAVCAMGQHCDVGWLPVLLSELRSPEPSMRFEAARACGELEDERAVPSLVELLKEQDSQIQEAAITALGHIGGEEARRALRGCLEQSDPQVREAARVALEELAPGEDPFAF